MMIWQLVNVAYNAVEIKIKRGKVYIYNIYIYIYMCFRALLYYLVNIVISITMHNS